MGIFTNKNKKDDNSTPFKTLRRVELFDLYDHTGIENHLRQMALNGWMFKKIHTLFCEYEQIEPTDIHFEVVYFATASLCLL